MRSPKRGSIHSQTAAAFDDLNNSTIVRGEFSAGAQGSQSTAINRVHVSVRIKPTNNFAHKNVQIQPDGQSLNIHCEKYSTGYINNQQQDWSFQFDRVCNNATQEQIYDTTTRSIVDALFDGYNGTILAYGQTGAGKTFTMTGSGESFQNRGLIPRTLASIYRKINERSEMAIVVRISYLEIYNEVMVDLLDSSSASSEKVLSAVEDSKGAINVRNLTKKIASTEEEALSLLFEGDTQRSVAEHQMNKSSSRSHCIFTVYLESRSRVESTERIIVSKLNLVDLAGSERLSKTKSEGLMMKEAMFINKSLTFLEQVIIALGDKKRDHIPYRQSSLTNVLKDSLGGSCNTHLIANISGEATQLEETISTLRFATRMLAVQTLPVANVQFDPVALVKKYEKQIEDLKQELSMHDTLSNRGQVQYEPYSEAQRFDVQRQIRRYVETDGEELPILNLRQITETYNQFKVYCRSLESDIYAKIQAEKQQQAGRQQDEYQNQLRKDTNAGMSQVNAAHFDEGGVGDLEGSGFAVGLAQSKPLLRPARATPTSAIGISPAQAMGANNMTIGQRAAKKASVAYAPNATGLSNTANTQEPPTAASLPAQNSALTMNANKNSQVPLSSAAMATQSSASIFRGSPGAGIKSALEMSSKDEPGSGTYRRASFADQSAIGQAATLQPTRRTSIGAAVPSSANQFGHSPIGNASKNEAFEIFRRDPTRDIMQTLEEQKTTLRNKRRVLRDLSEQLATVRADTENCRSMLNEKRKSRGQHSVTSLSGLATPKRISSPVKDSNHPPRFDESRDLISENAETRYNSNGSENQPDSDEEEELIDEEEYQLIKELNQLKGQYNDIYGKLKAAKTEADYCSHTVDQTRARMLNMFDAWYAEKFANNAIMSPGKGSPQAFDNQTSVEKSSPGWSYDGVKEDVLDYGEKFEKMQLENLSMAEPDSFTYYAAKKLAQRKALYGPSVLLSRRSPVRSIT